MDESSDSISDLFSDDDSDEYIPPTDSEDDEDLAFKRRRKQLSFKYALKSSSVENIEATGPSRSQLTFTIHQDSSNIEHAIKQPKMPFPTRGVSKRLRFSPQNASNESNENFDEPLAGIHILDENATVEPRFEIETKNNGQDTPKKKPRKVMANPSKWKSSVRKRSCQAGEAYVNRRGKDVKAKEVKTLKDCLKACKFKCNTKVSNCERNEIHTSFYSLSYNEKRHFLLGNSERSLTARPKRSDENKIGEKRKYSFRYYFTLNSERVQVCKSFFLGTLSISQKPVYTAHALKNMETNTPSHDKRGKSVFSRRVPEGDLPFAKEHIESFPTVESHYCRAKTNRLYLGSHLSVSKMYDLYVEKCNDESKSPVKQSQYHKTFVTEYNLGFHVPKSDRCELCEKHKMACNSGTLGEKLTDDYLHHIVQKTSMRLEANNDRENMQSPVLIFDLENVITCPRADIGPFFYKRKLNIYNMTAYLTSTKQVYCAIWNETMAGRAGNDLASAVRKILDKVAEENDLTNLVTWLDSCVPQNRNSIMSYAILDFLKENEDIESVTMKYSVPGHSCVQAVDSVHSVIERAMQTTEFYSPIGLIRILKQANRKRPYRIIQMKESDFKDFGAVAKLLNFKNVPYTKIASIRHTQTLHEVEFKTSHDPFEPTNLARLRFEEKPKRNNKKISQPVNVFNVEPKVEKNKQVTPPLKIKDIKSMFSVMPQQDKAYYEAIFKIQKT